MSAYTPRNNYATPGNWDQRANCIGRTDDMVMPTRDDSRAHHASEKKIANARAICAGCAVFDECRDWALTEPDPAFGLMAGGLTPTERKTERKKRLAVMGSAA